MASFITMYSDLEMMHCVVFQFTDRIFSYILLMFLMLKCRFPPFLRNTIVIYNTSGKWEETVREYFYFIPWNHVLNETPRYMMAR